MGSLKCDVRLYLIYGLLEFYIFHPFMIIPALAKYLPFQALQVLVRSTVHFLPESLT